MTTRKHGLFFNYFTPKKKDYNWSNEPKRENFFYV